MRQTTSVPVRKQRGANPFERKMRGQDRTGIATEWDDRLARAGQILLYSSFRNGLCPAVTGRLEVSGQGQATTNLSSWTDKMAAALESVSASL